MARRLQFASVMEHDMELGPAGQVTGAAKTAQVVSPGEAPAPTGPAPGGLTEVAKAVIPGVANAMKAIDVAVKAWDLIKPISPTVSFGPHGNFPAGIGDTTREQIERATRYALATAFIKVIMKLGTDAGIDFTTWKGGLPPVLPPGPPPGPAAPAHAPTPASPAGGSAHAPAPPAPAHGNTAPAPPAQEAPDMTRFQPLFTFLADSSLAEVKSEAKIALNDKIQRYKLPMPKWYWNGSDQKGFGEPPQVGQFTKVEESSFWSLGPPLPYDRDADGRTYFQMFDWHLSVAKLPESVMLGLPPEMLHFSNIPFQAGPATNVGWFEEGGTFATSIQVAHGDTLTIQGGSNIFKQGINPPIGGYSLSFEFMWDRGPTSVDFEISFDPFGMHPTAMPDAKGVPAT